MRAQELIDSSVARYSALGRQIIDMPQFIMSGIDFPYFIVTVDLANDMFYAPVAGGTLDILADLPGGQDLDTLETLRRVFRIPVHSALRRAIDAALPLVRGTRQIHVLALTVTREGRVLRFQGSPDDACGRELEKLFAITLGQPLVERLFLLRREIPGDETVLVLGLGGDPGPEDAGRNQFIQLGAMTEFDATRHVDDVRRLLALSSWATFVLHYDRERYFQKAVRQAIRGTIVKVGDTAPIRAQKEKLEAVGGATSRGLVPHILRRDADLEAAPAVTWFEMPRYSIPSLLDILTSLEGLTLYEVVPLVRAAVTHLRQVFWRESAGWETFRIHAAVAAPLLLLQSRFDKTVATLQRRGEEVEAGVPVKRGWSVDIFSPDKVAPVKELQAWLSGSPDKACRIQISWQCAASIPSMTLRCRHPLAILKDLRAALSKIPHKPELRRLVLNDGHIHGDAHFGNFLMDASIPEDPLVVSIDPADVVPDINESLLAHYSEAEKSHVRTATEALRRDPTYDLSKLLVSTCGFYGLASKRAFDIATTQTAEGVLEVTVARAGQAKPEKLHDAGGVSGAHLVKLAPTVAEDAFRYHLEARIWMLAETDRIISEAIGVTDSGNDDDCRAACNIALVKTWLLTVRHAFSLAEHMFPQEPHSAAAMLAIAVALLQRGADAAVRVLSNVDASSVSPSELLSMEFTDSDIGEKIA